MKTTAYRAAELLCAAALICFILFSAAAHTGGTRKTAKELEASFEDALTAAGMVRQPRRTAEERFGLPPEKTAGVVYYANESVMDVSELLIVLLQDPADAAEIRRAVEARVEEQKELYRSYAPAQYALLENSVVAVSGNAVFYCTAENADELHERFDRSL